MATNVADQAVIGFIRDCDPENLGEQWIYQITDGGVKTNKPVGVSNGESIEHFLFETMDRLKVVREATAGGWTATKSSEISKNAGEVTPLKVTKSWSRITFQTQRTSKTNTNYEKLVRLFPTNLGDHPYPGNKS